MQRKLTGREDAWNERAGGDTPGWRLDATSFEAFLEDARQLERVSPWNRLLGRAKASHLARAQYFLPHPFANVLDQGGWVLGSLPTARDELLQVTSSERVSAALEVMTEAIGEACKARLPLVLDW